MLSVADEDESIIVPDDRAFVLERILCKRRSGGRLLQESWSIGYETSATRAFGSARAPVDALSTCEDAARHAPIHFTSSTCSGDDATCSPTTIATSQRRRVGWHDAECFSRGHRKSKSWFALWNSSPRPERHGFESLSAGRGQVYRCQWFRVRVRCERSIHRQIFSGSLNSHGRFELDAKGNGGAVFSLSRTICMRKPKRIQRSRAKGQKMPANAIYVGRPTVKETHMWWARN